MQPLLQFFEMWRDVRVKRIFSGGIFRLETPMFVHPEPRAWIFPNEWLERIPASLGNLGSRCVLRRMYFRMTDHAIAAPAQVVAMRGKDGCPRPLMQPGVRQRYACLHAETVNHNGRLRRSHIEVDQNRSASAAP